MVDDGVALDLEQVRLGYVECVFFVMSHSRLGCPPWWSRKGLNKLGDMAKEGGVVSSKNLKHVPPATLHPSRTPGLR